MSVAATRPLTVWCLKFAHWVDPLGQQYLEILILKFSSPTPPQAKDNKISRIIISVAAYL